MTSKESPTWNDFSSTHGKKAWNVFLKLHKGMSQSKVSELYGLFKDGQYEIPTDAVSTTEEVEETKAKKMEEAVIKSKSAPKVDTTKELIVEYKALASRLTRFGRSMTAEVKAESEARLKELAALTAPSNYKCEPTDGWKLWTGPSQASLLVNETKRVAFRVSRSWWTGNYQGARYVSYETCAEQATLDGIAFQYERRRALVPRPPLSGVEIQLPMSARDVRLRGE
jgi:hypothetical protein